MSIYLTTYEVKLKGWFVPTNDELQSLIKFAIDSQRDLNTCLLVESVNVVGREET